MLTPLTEKQFQQQVIDLAHAFGWRVAHFRSVRVARRDGSIYHATPVQADGEGFTDLVLAHKEKRRVIFAELKADVGRLSPNQVLWGEILDACPGEYYVWKPVDFEDIQRILSGQAYAK